MVSTKEGTEVLATLNSTLQVRASRIFILLFLVCFGDISSQSLAADIPTNVKKSLEQNAARLSPITIRWKYQLVERDIRSYLSEAMLKKINPEAYVEQEVTYKFENGRYFFRREFSESVQDASGNTVGGMKRRYQEKSFDSARVYMLSSTTMGEEPWHVSVQYKTNLPVLRDSFFEKAGFRLPNVENNNGSVNSQEFVPVVLAMLDDGEKPDIVEESVVDGKPCLRIVFDTGSIFSLKPREIHEFYLDRDCDYTLRRHDIKRPDGTILVRIVLSDIQRVGGADGPWLPWTCRVSYYQYQGLPKTPAKSVVLEDEYRVEACSLADIPDSTFVLNYLRPGMRVGDATLPGAEKTEHGFVDYTVPANPADLDEVIAQAIRRQVPVTIQGWTFSRIALLCVNVFLIVMLIVYIGRRRRRRRRRLSGTSVG